MANSTQQDKPAVTIKDLAAKLGTDAKDLRRFIRGMELGVGRGGRYRWDTLSDPQPKKIAAAWKKANAAQKEA
jgi:hypothetical protein